MSGTTYNVSWRVRTSMLLAFVPKVAVIHKNPVYMNNISMFKNTMRESSYKIS